MLMAVLCCTEHAKECRRLHGMAVQVSMALLLYLVGLTIYAARRRTELRERFNIAGVPRTHSFLTSSHEAAFLPTCFKSVRMVQRSQTWQVGNLCSCSQARCRSSCLAVVLCRQRSGRFLRLVLVPDDGAVPGDAHAGGQQCGGGRLARPRAGGGGGPVHGNHAAQGQRDEHVRAPQGR